MMTTANAWKEFYQKLGYLFYGIATAEGGMNPDKLEMLKKQVHGFWQNNKSDLIDFHADTENNIDTMFDWLNLNENPWEDCIREFQYFAGTFGPEMPDNMKSFVIESSKQISNLFGTSNNPALSQLTDILDN